MIDFRLTPREFRSTHFEQGPYLFKAALPERPLTWADFEELLHLVPPHAPALRLFRHGIVPEREFTEEIVVLSQSRPKLDKVRFYDYMRNGATLVINRLEDYSMAAKRLCMEIARFAGAQASGNAYVSFKGDGTFGKHWDTHDVFAIQLIGRKCWRIYAPTFPLPLTYQTNDRSGHVCPAEPTLELVLEEGDVLYLPRGWWHHVIPLDEGSFHLSVGVYPPTYYDYVMWTAAQYLQRLVDLRRAYCFDERGRAGKVLEALPALLADARNAAEFERQTAASQPLSSDFNVDLFLEPRRASLSPTSLISLTTYAAPKLERSEMLVNGSRLELDAQSRAVVVALGDSLWIAFDELCERLPELSRDAVHRAVLNLARHDIVTIRHEP